MAKPVKKAICWLRRDLRLYDHTPLSLATTEFDQVAVVFIFDTQILKHLKNKTDKRVQFIHESLVELQIKLQGIGSELIVLHGDPQTLIPDLAQQLNVNAVITGNDYEPYAIKRDANVQKKLSVLGIDFLSVKDHVIFEKSEILTASNSPYKVFTPYKNAWLKHIRKKEIEERKVQKNSFIKKSDIVHYLKPWSLNDIGFNESDLIIPSGSDAGRKLLQQFSKIINDYKNDRDFPAKEKTSKLGIHFRFGTVSIREAVRLASDVRSDGSRTWLSELIWRDFYHMILFQFPHVVSSAFKNEYDDIKWTGTKLHFELWKNGQTGFPIIDAAMRDFAKTGWMHNRLRMIVASFLTKDLLVNWKWGESYFADTLLDYDLASNNGGWQWSASTGCDAQPYFRIFNPFSQSERFDPDGSYIREHVPELKNFDARYIHNPAEAPLDVQKKANCIVGKDYPHPIVNHSEQREKALALFKK